ncbi:hypothetical protein M422DRAFT_49095 [Sphaerobolus stellatus SS14]|uniref:Uncharacterized protein n=1 Tax=Sphaerobolus stellatus (strain SS14) TaxID=990650 RepID=A0A0C9V0C3_SPHS4|nr:hypothetical protein M422DRAFT_49095 [Sphaerobolus stellatus SS14]
MVQSGIRYGSKTSEAFLLDVFKSSLGSIEKPKVDATPISFLTISIGTLKYLSKADYGHNERILLKQNITWSDGLESLYYLYCWISSCHSGMPLRDCEMTFNDFPEPLNIWGNGGEDLIQLKGKKIEWWNNHKYRSIIAQPVRARFARTASLLDRLEKHLIDMIMAKIDEDQSWKEVEILTNQAHDQIIGMLERKRSNN